MSDDDRREQPDIDLSLEDLEETEERAGLPPVPVPAVPPSGSMLVIENEDLLELPEESAAYPAAAAYPTAGPAAYPPPGKVKQGVLAGGLTGSLLIQMALLGLLGGLLAWGATEPVSYIGDPGSGPLATFMPIILAICLAGAALLGLALGFAQTGTSERGSHVGPLVGVAAGLAAAGIAVAIGWLRSRGYVHSDENSLAYTTVFAGFIGMMTGLCIGITDGLYSANLRKALIGGAVGLGCGLVSGSMGGLFAQIFYGWAAPEGNELSLRQVVARTLGWGIAGIAIGLGLGLAHGLPSKSPRKIVNGIMGGAIGGFAGGFLFDPLAMVVGGFGSRLLAMLLIGGLSGAAIGLIEQMRKEAWLAVVGGPLTGKQFILYNTVTTIGSSPKCTIALLKDPHIAPEHCVIEMTGAAYQLRDLAGATLVNSRPIQRHQLRPGDIITIGATSLEYQDRAIAEGGQQ